MIFANEGKELYLEAKCQKCHLQDEKFDPNSIKKEGVKSKVKNLKELKKWVIDCDNYFSVGWFPEEQDKVVKYLNETFYKLKK
jgi:hypothetical protein